MWKVGLLLWLVGCVQSTAKECEVGTPYERLCAASAICDTANHICAEPSQLAACDGLADGTACTADMVPGLCHAGACLPPRCGDGFATDGEECDGSDLGSASDCTSLSYYDPSPLGCKADCTYDKSQCLGYCGDGLVDPRYEICDGGPPAESCVDLGYGAGALGCRQCGPAFESCRYFGWHQPVVTPHYMFDVSAIDDTHVYAVGVHGVVYRFDGNGWMAIDISSCFPTFDMSELDTVHAIAADDLWIGGQDFMTNGAIAIHVTKTGCVKTDVASSTEVKQIFAISDTDVYAAVGAATYHYDGAAWIIADATAAQYVWASGPGDVYTAAYNGTSLRHLTGGTWQTESLPSSMVVASLWGRGASDFYVGGSLTTVPASASVLLHWTGSSWVDVSPIINSTNVVTGSISSIGTLGSRLFIADDSAAARVYEYDGSTWTDLQFPNHGGIPGRLALTPSGQLYATEGLAYLDRFGGTMPIASSWTYGIVLRAIAPAANNVYIGSGGSLYTWDGSSWTWDSGSGGVNDIWVDAAGTVFAAQSGAVRKRTAPNTWAVVDAVGASRIWGFADNDIWTTAANKQSFQHWNGTSTTVCASCATTNININDLWGFSPTDLIAVGDGGHAWRYDGTKWNALTTGTSQHLRSIWASSGSDVVAIGDTGTVLHYDGATWTDLSFPTKVFTLTAVWGTSQSDLFVSTGAGDLYRYDGARWSPVDITGVGGLNWISGAGDSMFLFGSSKFERLIRTVAW